MHTVLDFRRWARAVVLSACGLGAGALLAQDIYQPLTPLAPQRAVAQAEDAQLEPPPDAIDPSIQPAPAGETPPPPPADTPPPETCPQYGQQYYGWQECPQGNGENGEEAEEEEAPAGPWNVLDVFADEDGTNVLKDSGWIAGGWTAVGYATRPDGAFVGNGPFLDDREHWNVNLNQQYFYFGKVADGSEGLGLGFRGDIMYGVDGNEGQSFGNVNPGHWDFLNGYDHGIYEWALPQAYGEVAYKDLSVKLGHFYTPTGYEVVPPADNFFSSHQILWYNGEPFTHTGALGTYKASDELTLQGGWVLGWDTGFYQFAGGNMALVGAAYQLGEKTNISYFGAIGDSGWRGNSVLNGVILKQQWTDKLRSIHQFDVFDSNNASDPNAPGGNFALDGVAGDHVGQVNYLIYDITDQLAIGARDEWMKMDGISYYTFTYGVNIKPVKNLLIRPEVKHNFVPGDVPGGPPGSIAANVDRVYDNATIFSIDAVLLY